MVAAATMVDVADLAPGDRTDWEALFRAYIDFYRSELPPEMYDRAWVEIQAGTRIRGLGGRLQGRLVGITHFLVHPSTWGADVCYLQDLFTAPEARGRGVARSLITGVCDWAREQGCSQAYWLTHETNSTARRLYDQVAQNRGFIQYRIGLGGS